MPYAQKAPPISYADGPRLQRAIQALGEEQRNSFVAVYNDHLVNHSMQSLQRRGQFLYITLSRDSEETVSIFDFGQAAVAQSCLTALTDCLRGQRAAVKVLMPVAPPKA